MRGELQGKTSMKSANLYGDPIIVFEYYGYDAESHADEEIGSFLDSGPV